MRLIDADEFESYLIGRYGGNDTAEDIIEDLHKQPTVSPDMAQFLAYECGKQAEERKTGEWVKNEDRNGWHCSCCKVDNYYAYSWNSDTGKNEFQDNFCPNCGARMEV